MVASATNASADVAAVILTSAVRSMSNPSQDVQIEIGGIRNQPAIFNGWTLPELAVLHAYRRRSA